MRRLRIKDGLLIAAVLLPWGTQAAAQDLIGFKITMSKRDICRYVEEHPTHSFKDETKCPETGSRVIVKTTEPELSSISVVTLAFDYHGELSTMWSKFPSSDFNSVYEMAVKKFGKPAWNKQYTPGKDGASLPNQLVYWHLKAADIYLERQNKLENGQATGWLALDEPAPFPMVPPASFTVWNTRKIDPAASWGDRTTTGR
jgi:hypothetical protein